MFATKKRLAKLLAVAMVGVMPVVLAPVALAFNQGKSCPVSEAAAAENKACVGCSLNGVWWESRILRGWDLSYSNFRGSVLRYADLRGANLAGVDFSGADLTGVLYDDATNTSGATFCHTIMPNGRMNYSDCS